MKTEKQHQILAAFKALDKINLNGGTAVFIKSLRKDYQRNKNLSERQIRALFEIRDSVLSNV